MNKHEWKDAPLPLPQPQPTVYTLAKKLGFTLLESDTIYTNYRISTYDTRTGRHRKHEHEWLVGTEDETLDSAYIYCAQKNDNPNWPATRCDSRKEYPLIEVVNMLAVNIVGQE